MRWVGSGIFGRLLTEESGQDMIEYALLAGFASLTVGGVFVYIAASAFHIFDKVAKILANGR